jgi:hypothetical protein
MEDFRYFESILRFRESQYISYVLRKGFSDKNSLKAFADLLTEVREFGQLSGSQTTTAGRCGQHMAGRRYHRLYSNFEHKPDHSLRNISAAQQA